MSETLDRSTFLAAYTRVLTNAWSSSDYAERLLSDPRSVLNEAGLVVPADASIEVTREIGGDANLDAQIDLWEKGYETHAFVLHVPESPMIDTSELSEGDLAAVSGGSTYYCCCCCPCCSCT